MPAMGDGKPMREALGQINAILVVEWPMRVTEARTRACGEIVPGEGGELGFL